jgi:hypothetical protein
LLEQEGASFSRLVDSESALHGFSAIVAARATSSDEKAVLREFLRAGGGIVGCAAYLRGVVDVAEDALHVKYLSPDTKGALRGLSLMDVEATGYLPREANCLRTDENVFAVFAGECNGGLAVITPFDPGTAMEDYRSVERYFHARTERLPSERVSRVGKGELLHFLHAALEYLHHERNIPYAALSPFPDQSENVYALRIDTDGGSREEIDDLYAIARENRIGFSWFLDVGSHASWLTRFAAMEDQEVALHCFDHRIYLDRERDAENIENGISAMKAAGLAPAAFAAPYGFWSPDLGKTIDRGGFSYSSEFGWAYDALPHYPVNATGRYQTLQVPIHPVSVGNLRKAGFHSSGMNKYFRGVVSRKLARREPLLFYHHPGHREWALIRSLCESAQIPGVRALTLGAYAAWWQKRAAVRPRFACDGHSLELTMDPLETPEGHGVFVRVSQRGGKEALLPLGTSMPLEAVPWKTVPPFVAPSDIKRMREFDLRGEIGRQFTRLQRRFP